MDEVRIGAVRFPSRAYSVSMPMTSPIFSEPAAALLLGGAFTTSFEDRLRGVIDEALSLLAGRCCRPAVHYARRSDGKRLGHRLGTALLNAQHMWSSRERIWARANASAGAKGVSGGRCSYGLWLMMLAPTCGRLWPTADAQRAGPAAADAKMQSFQGRRFGQLTHEPQLVNRCGCLFGAGRRCRVQVS